jgi:hypothetical protein
MGDCHVRFCERLGVRFYSLVGLCRRNTTSRVEEYGGLREVSFLSVKKQLKLAKFNSFFP